MFVFNDLIDSEFLTTTAQAKGIDLADAEKSIQTLSKKIRSVLEETLRIAYGEKFKFKDIFVLSRADLEKDDYEYLLREIQGKIERPAEMDLSSGIFDVDAGLQEEDMDFDLENIDFERPSN